MPGVIDVTRVFDTEAGIFGYVAFNQVTDLIVVAFRGSDNVANWISNMNFLMQDYKSVPGAKVHNGFYKAYLTV